MLSQNQIVESADISSLKDRIRREMGRRKHYGSLASSNKAFTNTSAVGDLAKLTHFNETVGHINQIAPTGIQSTLIYDISAAINSLSIYEQRPVSSSTNDCRSYCTGLCVTQCSDGCKSGCTGSCQGGCNTTCDTGCNTGCSDSCGLWNCGSGCSADCSWQCSSGAGCRNTCASGCADYGG